MIKYCKHIYEGAVPRKPVVIPTDPNILNQY